jgi:hypothetical protein
VLRMTAGTSDSNCNGNGNGKCSVGLGEVLVAEADFSATLLAKKRAAPVEMTFYGVILVWFGCLVWITSR